MNRENQRTHFNLLTRMFRLTRVLPRSLTRQLSTSLPRYSAPEPIITGPGGKSGEVPSDLDQATGLERFELLYRLRGEEAFSTEPLQVVKMGTVLEPISVFSLVRHPSCPDPTRCPSPKR